MKTSFLVRKSGANDTKTIYIQFYSKGNKEVFATRFSININDWAGGHPKAINSTKSLRSDLLEFQAKCDDFIKQMLDNEERTPTKGELKLLVDRCNGYTPDKLIVKDLLQVYLNDKDNKFKPATKQITEKAFAYLLELNSKLDFPDFAPPFGAKFQHHLLSKGLQNNSANKYIKKVKAFLNWAKKKEYINKDYSKYLETFQAVEPAIFSLTNEELIQIETSTNAKGKQVELSDRLERIKDLFLFGCYTGLRFEDLQAVNGEMIHNGHIHINNEKTSHTLKIPMLPEAEHIFEKYEGQLPQISNQKANEYLKELLKELGIDRKVLEVHQVGSEVTKVYTPLCDAITFHKSRKTFIVSALTAGIPAKIVKQMAGIKKDDTFNRYIEFADTVLSNEIMKMSRSARSMSKVS